jgi:hypothetical protein
VRRQAVHWHLRHALPEVSVRQVSHPYPLALTVPRTY